LPIFHLFYFRLLAEFIVIFSTIAVAFAYIKQPGYNFTILNHIDIFAVPGVRVLVGVIASYRSSPRGRGWVGGGCVALGAAALGVASRRLSWAPPGPMAPPGRTGERSCAI
jgi:hypothetical protein